MEKADKIWMNGTVVDWNDAHVHLISNTLQYGFGVFEGIRCYKTLDGPAVFRLKEHLRRLHSSAKIIGFTVPYSIEELTEATRMIIRENGFEQCYIRPIAYIGYGGTSRLGRHEVWSKTPSAPKVSLFAGPRPF